MKYNILIILIISLFINQLIAVNCPDGTSTAAGVTDVADNAALATCTHCQPNFYFNGGSASAQANGGQTFAVGAGVRGQCVACQIRKNGSVTTAGDQATLATQCSNACPTGTALDDGAAVVFVTAVSECVKCQANFYFNGGAASGAQNGGQAFVAGHIDAGAPNVVSVRGQCVACQIRKDGSVATAGDQATLATQCSNACPTGTALDDGAAVVFVTAVSECVKCQANFYFNGGAASGAQNGGQAFVAGHIDAAALGVVSARGQCVACQVKKTGSIATLGGQANLVTQCSNACPSGTALDDGVAVAFTTSLSQCVKCQANFYFNGNFNAGESQCTKCPVSKATPTPAPGGSATSATQCNSACPAGTVLDDGTSANFVAAASECSKCSANFYASKTSGFQAGTDTCTECPKKLTSGATAKAYAEATQKAQCASSTFAKFLSVSLIFISFYLL